MSGTVEIYIAGPAGAVDPPGRAGTADLLPVAQQVAVALNAPGCFVSDDTVALGLDAQEWIGGQGSAALTLSSADADADVSDWGETAFAPYSYELSLDYRSGSSGEGRVRLGRMVFEHLTSLGRPLAFGDGRDIFADHLPGRGIRDFPPGTDWDAPGRDRWYEPGLHGPGLYGPGLHGPEPDVDPARSRFPGRATVFEADGLLHYMPVYDGVGRAAPSVRFPLHPVLSLRTTAPAERLGLALALSLERSRSAHPATFVDAYAWITGIAHSGAVADYAPRAVSLDVVIEDGALAVTPRTPWPGGRQAHGHMIPQGPVADGLAVREVIQEAPQEVARWDHFRAGGLVTRLIEAVRSSGGR